MVKPNWSEWRDIPVTSLLEVCALSLNIEPSSIQKEVIDSDRRGQIALSEQSFSSIDEASEFYRRCKILYANINETNYFKEPNTLSRKTHETNVVRVDARIRISEFVAWATEKNWQLPTDMMKLHDETAVTPTVTRHIASKSRTHALDAVIKLAEKQALAPDDTSSIYAALVKLAASEDRPAPLLGYADDEGVKYQGTDGNICFYKRKNLSDRRSRKKRAD